MERGRFSIPLSGGMIAFAASSALAGLTPGPGYQVQHQINNAFVSSIDHVSDTQLVGTAFSATQDVVAVGLNNGPVSGPLYTQPALPGGSTFGGGFVATDGTYALTGQTGFPADAQGLYPGRVFLTNLSNGSSTSLSAAGNYDGVAAGGEFYITGAAGTPSGLIDNGSSGIYRVERSGGTLTNLNLVLDTGAPSGIVGGDSTGNLVFSLGGASPLLAGAANDLYRLANTQVATGVANGAATGLPGSAADKLITGAALSAAVSSFFNANKPAGGSIFTSVSDLVFDQNGDLFVAMTGVLFDQNFNYAGVIGQGLLLDVSDVGANYAASVVRTVYTHTTSGGGSLTYRASDNTLWVSDGGHIYAIALVPEPAAAAMLLLALPLLRRQDGKVTGAQ